MSEEWVEWPSRPATVLASTPARRRPHPSSASDTDAMLRELGVTAEELARLHAVGIVHGTAPHDRRGTEAVSRRWSVVTYAAGCS